MPWRRDHLRLFAALLTIPLFLSLLHADATLPEEGFGDEFESEFSAAAPAEDFDPLSGYNRVMTVCNDAVYIHVIFPVARGYEAVIPEEGRKAVQRFFANLHTPVRVVNNVLQLKFRNAAEELGRFTVNTTLGIGGLFDPAYTWLNLSSHPEDFGQTLGYYGVGSGFHIVLPLLGPSNLRDTVGLVSDSYIDFGLNYYEDRGLNLLDTLDHTYALESLEYLNKSSLTYAQYESLKKDALDLYPFLKQIYEQSRSKAIEE